MKTADGTIFFKEWLPDLPALDNPGLTEARECRPLHRVYASAPTMGAEATLPARPLGALDTIGYSYAGTAQDLYRRIEGGSWSALSSATYGAAAWSFAQFEDIVIAAGATTPQQHTVGAATGFTALAVSGAAPTSSAQVGIVNRFVVLGDFSAGAASIQWSAIDAPTNWPTPNSATAIATQSGRQDFDDLYGTVTAIRGGDQFGLVWQAGAIHRMTYVGGDVVFQFDRLSGRTGCYFQNSVVEAMGRYYFAGLDGFYVTDGVGVQSISDGKVSKWFRDTVDPALVPWRVWGALDRKNPLIYWGFPDVTSPDDRVNHILIFNYLENRWTRMTLDIEMLYSRAPTVDAPIRGFNASSRHGAFAAGVGSAILTTGETAFNRGGYARVQGVKPLVDVTANAVTVALGTRGDQETAPSFTSETTANSRSGFCDFRSEAKYHRARLTIAGTFNAAQGLEFQVVPSGAV